MTMDDNQNQGGQPTMPGTGMPGSETPAAGIPTPPAGDMPQPGTGMPGSEPTQG